MASYCLNFSQQKNDDYNKHFTPTKMLKMTTGIDHQKFIASRIKLC